MHRLMMTSNTYRQSSAVTPERETRDPDNRMLSRMPLRRLEAEELRDTLLLVAGRLDEKRFGPADPVQVLPDGIVQSGQRRSVYVQQLRKHPPTLLECFDLPAMNPNCLSRSDSLVALPGAPPAQRHDRARVSRPPGPPRAVGRRRGAARPGAATLFDRVQPAADDRGKRTRA